MKFVCNKQELLKGINTVIKATYTKFRNPSWSASILWLAALDPGRLRYSHRHSHKYFGDIEEPGQTCIPPGFAGDRQQIPG